MSEAQKNMKMLLSLSAKDCRVVSSIFEFSDFSRFSNRHKTRGTRISEMTVGGVAPVQWHNASWVRVVNSISTCC